jgi:hypothetical protein
MYLGAACPRCAKRTDGALLVAQQNFARQDAVHNPSCSSAAFTNQKVKLLMPNKAEREEENLSRNISSIEAFCQQKTVG